MPASELTVRVHSNLAALLLEAGRLEEALQELDRGAEEVGSTEQCLCFLQSSVSVSVLRV